MADLLGTLTGAGTALGGAMPYVAGGLTALSAINKFITGNKQGKLADQYARTPRPMRTTSPYLFENKNMATNIAGSGLPGEGFLRNRLDRAIGASANAAVNAGYGTPDILASISANNSQLLDKEAELGYKAADYRLKGQGMMMGANNALASDAEKNWDWNKKQPYLDAMAAASAMRNASMLNKSNALDQASKIPLMFANVGKKVPSGNSVAQRYQDENTQYIKTGMNNSTIYDDNKGSIG